MKIKRRKGEIAMSNEIIMNYKGKNCKIYTGPFGTNIVGKITAVNENWIEVETKKGKEVVNADFVSNIKIKN
jgi:hypothetical protein